MKFNIKNQAGFAALELLLVVIALAMLGGTGYYVYSANKKTNSTLNSAAKIAQSTPAPVKTFKFDNLGVQIKLPAALSDLQYYPQSYADGSAGGYVSTTTIANLIKQCTQGQATDPESISFAGLGKLPGQFDASQTEESSLLKQFSSFSVTIGYPNGGSPCDPGQPLTNKVRSAESAAQAALVKAFQSSATEVK